MDLMALMYLSMLANESLFIWTDFSVSLYCQVSLKSRNYLYVRDYVFKAYGKVFSKYLLTEWIPQYLEELPVTLNRKSSSLKRKTTSIIFKPVA